MVVREGGCSFPAKASRAQGLGARGVIFGSNDVKYTQGDVVISDDGTGSKVKIAVIFALPEDAQKLAKLANARIKVEFELARGKTSIVNIFLSASGRHNYVYLRNLKPYLMKVINSVKVNVAYHTVKC